MLGLVVVRGTLVHGTWRLRGLLLHHWQQQQQQAALHQQVMLRHWGASVIATAGHQPVASAGR